MLLKLSFRRVTKPWIPVLNLQIWIQHRTQLKIWCWGSVTLKMLLHPEASASTRWMECLWQTTRSSTHVSLNFSLFCRGEQSWEHLFVLSSDIGSTDRDFRNMTRITSSFCKQNQKQKSTVWLLFESKKPLFPAKWLFSLLSLTGSLNERHIKDGDLIYAIFTPKENLKTAPKEPPRNDAETYGADMVRCHVMLKASSCKAQRPLDNEVDPAGRTWYKSNRCL